jgi:hypothetical protein
VCGLTISPSTAFAQPAARADAAQAAVLTGAIDAVTVYRGQALVTRVIDVPGGPGLREVVVTDLPEALVPGSLYAESADGIEIRSVSYRIRPVGEDNRENVRAAEKAVRDASDALDAAKSRQKYLEWQNQYLDKLEQFVAPTAQAELKAGVLNAETLTNLTELITTRRKAQTEEAQKLSIELRTLNEALQLRERERNVLTASTSRTAREAVVFLNAAKAGSKVRLSYLVDGANWTPSFNLRIAGADAQTAALEYQASVRQMSGEDWTSVELTLSTATPALVATGPMLQPLTVALAAPQEAGQTAIALLRDKDYFSAKRELEVQQRVEERNRALTAANEPASKPAGPSGGGQAIAGRLTLRSDASNMQLQSGEPIVLALDDGLNDLAKQSQLLDLVSNSKVERKSSAQQPLAVRQGDEGVSVTYRIASRTSMPSRADQQLIQIAQMTLPAKLTKLATPTLTQYVYNEAEITNNGEMLLLAGPAASYVAGQFVGSGGVPTVAAGESFRAGFGIDTSLRAGKELVERTETTQGGNRIVEYTYRLTIENFGKPAAAVRVLDRLPSPKAGEIKLTLVSQSPDLSQDKAYLETDRKKNLLRWDLNVASGKTGMNAEAIEYKFRLEFDRQMTLTEGK